MPRTKGSKNKPKVVNDFASQIAEKQFTIESLNTEIASITANIDSLKVNLKAKRAALKIAEKEVGKLEAKKSKEEQKVAEEAKKAEAETMLKKLIPITLEHPSETMEKFYRIIPAPSGSVIIQDDRWFSISPAQVDPHIGF